MSSETKEDYAKLIAQALSDYDEEMVKAQDRGSPQHVEKDSQYKFMREILNTEKSTKVANVTAEELGNTNLSVRGLFKISLLSQTLGLDESALYYGKRAEIVNATSMAKKATFLNLLFTQIRKTIVGTNKGEPKRGLFNFKGGGGSEQQS